MIVNVPPFLPKQFVRIKASGTILNVARCEKRVVHGALRWIVDGLNGMRAFADDCELVKNMQLVNAETGEAVIHLEKPVVRYACSKEAKVEPMRYVFVRPPETKGGMAREEGFVLEADHDAAIRKKDAEISDLKRSFKFISHSLEERNKDALAKDAEIAELLAKQCKHPSAFACLNEAVEKLKQRAERAEAELAEAKEHERQTHERLGAILGTDDSLEECAKRLKADRDAIRVQWQSLHDEREEQYAALRRRGIRFIKVGGILEAIGADVERDMLKSGMPQADIDEAEEVAEGCVANSENLDDVSHPELSLICNRLLELRYQRDFLQRHVRERDLLVNELTEQVKKHADDAAQLRKIVGPLDELRQDEGTTVGIICDNPDFGSGPDAQITVTADWTNWKEEHFPGKSLAECLEYAAVVRKARSRR